MTRCAIRSTRLILTGSNTRRRSRTGDREHDVHLGLADAVWQLSIVAGRLVLPFVRIPRPVWPVTSPCPFIGLQDELSYLVFSAGAGDQDGDPSLLGIDRVRNDAIQGCEVELVWLLGEFGR